MSMNSGKAAAILILTAALMTLSSRPSSAQPQPQLPPDRTSPCPVTHDCRAVTHGMQTQSGASQPAKTVTCPPGTVQIPNTNRCKVLSPGP